MEQQEINTPKKLENYEKINQAYSIITECMHKYKEDADTTWWVSAFMYIFAKCCKESKWSKEVWKQEMERTIKLFAEKWETL